MRRSYRADLHKKVAIGANPLWAELTALQLAVRLGDREMVRFVLNRHCIVDWLLTLQCAESLLASATQ